MERTDSNCSKDWPEKMESSDWKTENRWTENVGRTGSEKQMRLTRTMGRSDFKHGRSVSKQGGHIDTSQSSYFTYAWISSWNGLLKHCQTIPSWTYTFENLRESVILKVHELKKAMTMWMRRSVVQCNVNVGNGYCDPVGDA